MAERSVGRVQQLRARKPGVGNPSDDEWEWDRTVSTTAPQLMKAMKPVASLG